MIRPGETQFFPPHGEKSYFGGDFFKGSGDLRTMEVPGSFPGYDQNLFLFRAQKAITSAFGPSLPGMISKVFGPFVKGLNRGDFFQILLDFFFDLQC